MLRLIKLGLIEIDQNLISIATLYITKYEFVILQLNGELLEINYNIRYGKSDKNLLFLFDA